MKESLRLSLSQKLQQRLSPLQMRFVRMLEMTGPEVEEEVRRELDDNPALEIADRSDSETPEDDFHESAEEMQLADYKDEDEIPAYRLEARNSSRDDVYYEPVAVAGENSLGEWLMNQLRETDINDTELLAAGYIIGNLDDNGYLTRTLPQILDDLAINAGLELTMEQLGAVADRIRALDPAGVCAYDLRDCLSLQLKRLEPTSSRKIALEIVDYYFDLFSLRHYDRLGAALGIDRDSLRDAIDVIRSLNPKPGGIIGDSDADVRSRHIIPDFNVEVDGDSITLTLLNNIPDLTIEKSFSADGESFSVASTAASRKDAMAFVSRKREDATDFIDLLRLRQQTLYNVMAAIVRLQRDFFVSEDETRLRPMILKDVSRETGYDLSVISRATAGKYVSTPVGIYPLKFFFNERVGGDDEETSSREILAVIREIIEGEDPLHPFSDDALMKELNDRGYEIARRTVSKYRERLGLPVARLRKGI